MERKGGCAVIITLPLEPQDEARLLAAAHALGLPPDALVRAALNRILSEAPDDASPATGAALVAAMQASPYREMEFDLVGDRLPVRDVRF
jgi:hypothetical protein